MDLYPYEEYIILQATYLPSSLKWIAYKLNYNESNTWGFSFPFTPQDKVRLRAASSNHIKAIWSSHPHSGYWDILVVAQYSRMPSTFSLWHCPSLHKVRAHKTSIPLQICLNKLYTHLTTSFFFFNKFTILFVYMSRNLW